MNQYKNPQWWTPETDRAWEHTRDALRRGWDFSRHGANEGAPNQPVFEELEPLYRFGYGARSHYSDHYSEWNNSLEKQLREDWLALYPERVEQWKGDATGIRYGWEYNGVILDDDDALNEAEMQDSASGASGKM